MYQRVIKRVADFLISLVLVVLLFIPGLIVALVIKLDSKGPVFFKQTRYTKDTRPFTMIKFRTMVTDAPIQAAGQIQNPKQYITKFGRILRETSIDELPQLLNV
ncbi:MAG: sugar transferase, partial [Lactobacillaceae bacterium]|nr:sugar transferase [Lactobacillaceae bacterium]